MPDELYAVDYDERLADASGLTWLPWVGASFVGRPEDQRLLIVGESHYVRPKEGDDLARVIADHMNYPAFTRDVVVECLINQEWANRTLDTIPKLLFGTGDIDRERFWSDTAFYNFIQSPMNYNQEGAPERPSWDSYVSGWATFTKVIDILRPSHCLFIGVEAFNSFNYAMSEAGVRHEHVQWTEQISRTYGRLASVTNGSDTLTLAGVQHLGKYCSWSQWRDYLRRKHPDMVALLDAGRYTEIKEAQQDETQQPPLAALSETSPVV